MANWKLFRSIIKGIVCTIPPIVKKIDDEARLYGWNPKQISRIKQTIGLDKRFVVDEKTTTADLCEIAALRLFEKLEVSKESIGAIICVTQTPDYFQPANACCLHGRLGLGEKCAAFDVNQGCTGYIYGLWLAQLMIEGGECENVLLLAGDTISKCVNPRDKSVAILFGDGASATLVQKNESRDNPAFFVLHTDGTGYNHLIVPAGAFRSPKCPETGIERADEEGNIRSAENLYMNGAEIFNFSIKVEPKIIDEILKYSKMELADIDYIVFHQANKYIISNIVRRLGFPLDKAPCGTVEKYGNQSSASIPVTICDALGGDLTTNARQVILSGFGVGLSWAACLTTLKNTYTEIIHLGRNA